MAVGSSHHQVRAPNREANLDEPRTSLYWPKKSKPSDALTIFVDLKKQQQTFSAKEASNPLSSQMKKNLPLLLNVMVACPQLRN
jgi:hypothetical protein